MFPLLETLQFHGNLRYAMPFQPAPDCAEAVINAISVSKPLANVLNFAKPGGYTTLDLAALAAAVDVTVGAYYLQKIAAGVNYLNTHVKGLAVENDYEAINVVSAGPGTMPGTYELPENVTFCVKLSTGLTGRSARGRFYTLPFADSGLLGVSTVTTAYQSGIEAFLAQIKTATAAAGWTWVVLSRFHDKAKRPTAIYYPIVGAAARNNTTDSQRHRLPKGH